MLLKSGVVVRENLHVRVGRHLFEFDDAVRRKKEHIACRMFVFKQVSRGANCALQHAEDTPFHQPIRLAYLQMLGIAAMDIPRDAEPLGSTKKFVAVLLFLSRHILHAMVKNRLFNG